MEIEIRGRRRDESKRDERSEDKMESEKEERERGEIKVREIEGERKWRVRRRRNMSKKE